MHKIKSVRERQCRLDVNGEGVSASMNGVYASVYVSVCMEVCKCK